MRNEFLPFAKPSIDEATINEVVACLRSGWLTTGPRVAQFEKDLAEFLHAPYALCVNSGTSGLHLALMSLKLKPGDEVITTAFTFVSTLNTIVHAGATPVCVDIDLDTLNINIEKIQSAITKKTKAIVPVHFAGLPVDLAPIYQIARDHHLTVIEDAAHAIGAFYQGQRIGSFGDMQVFSFHPNKNMTTGEGGCVTLRDDSQAKLIKVMRFHGIDRDSFNRFSKDGKQDYDVIFPGFKYNMMDLQAALGIHQLKKLDSFIARRTHLAKRYLEKLKGLKALILPSIPHYDHVNAWHLFIVMINPRISKLSREQFMTQLKQRNIGTGLHYTATHLFDYYQKQFGYKPGDFPNAEFAGQNVVSLPLFPDMTESVQDEVIQAIYEIFN